MFVPILFWAGAVLIVAVYGALDWQKAGYEKSTREELTLVQHAKEQTAVTLAAVDQLQKQQEAAKDIRRWVSTTYGLQSTSVQLLRTVPPEVKLVEFSWQCSEDMKRYLLSIFVQAPPSVANRVYQRFVPVLTGMGWRVISLQQTPQEHGVRYQPLVQWQGQERSPVLSSTAPPPETGSLSPLNSAPTDTGTPDNQ
jgi:hypothetical protein